jgi:hypothetical protein
MKTQIYILLVFAILSSNVFSQYILDYSNDYSPSNRYFKFSIVDVSGNTYVTTQSHNYQDSANIVTMKFSPAGLRLWISIYDGPGHSVDRPIGITGDASGNLYVFSTIRYTDSSYISIMKYNSATGAMISLTALPGTGRFDFSEAVFDNKYIYATGRIYRPSNSAMAMIRTKYDGSYTRIRTFDALYGSGHSIALDKSKNIYVSGHLWNAGGYYDCQMLKYDSSCTQRWILNMGKYNPDGGRFSKVLVDALDCAVVTYQMDKDRYHDLIVTKKFTSAVIPVMSWERNYSVTDDNFGPYNFDGYKDFTIDNSRNIIVAGSTGDTSLLVKYNASGTMLWTKKDVVNAYEFKCITTDNTRNIYVAGDFRSRGTAAKYNGTSSALIWRGEITYPSGIFLGDKISLDVSSRIHVLGARYYGVLPYRQITILSYSPIAPRIAVTEKSSFSLGNNFPNPFNPVTSIRFSIPVYGSAVLRVYDNIGREVAVLVNGNLEPGEHEVTFDASGLSSGIYFYKLESGKYSEIRKMVLVK